VGTEFELRLGPDIVALELIAVEPLSSGTRGPGARAPFSLTFRHDGERRHAAQRIYTLRHVELGALEIFLVPIGPDDRGMCYEAVFT
jgi:hypothetical protein